MTEIATLRRLRAANSKLMKGNLTLLMSIRETDSEINSDWLELQQLYARLETSGLAIPSSCLELMGDAVELAAREQESAASSASDDAREETSRSLEDRNASSVISMRSVLNAEQPDRDEEDEDMEGSAAHDRSTSEP